jgi:hypothetical protein
MGESTKGRGGMSGQAGVVRTSRVIAIAIVLAFAVLGSPGASVALASPPTITLRGAGSDEPPGDPDGDRDNVSVSATFSNGIATGTMRTEGRRKEGPPGLFNYFEGNVTCMVVQGNRVVVGALGEAFEQEEQNFARFAQKPGTYAQVLTVEFGTFMGFEGVATDSWDAQFGTFDEGTPAATPPDCGVAFPWTSQKVGKVTDAIHLSPEITSPTDGSVISSHAVTLSGIAEPNAALEVYEVGQSSSGQFVTVPADGAWSTMFTGVPDGMHIFTAAAIEGSTVPANTVQVNVEVSPPSSEPQPPGSGIPGGLVAAIVTASPTIIANNGNTPVVRPVVKLSLGGGRRAKFAGRHLGLSVESNTTGNATVSGHLSIQKRHRQLHLGSQVVALTAARVHDVSLGLSATAAHQLQLAKRRHESITALVTITLRTGTGQTHTERIVLNVS